ncbi:MAG TPA: MATE family efflux transporter, partial [Thermomonas sp.]|nr:MATE family efflux transporter [Thermomonas sp.]
MLVLIYTVAMGLSIGATALVARRTGAHDPDGASHAAGQSILLGLGVAAIIALTAAPNASRLLALMGGSPELIRSGHLFTTIMLGGNATVLLLFLLNAVFRGAGDAAIAMRVLWLANGLNILLCPLLIFGYGPFPELGIEGAAIATNIGRGVGVLFQLWVLLRGGQHIRVLGSQIAWHGAMAWNIVRTSLGGVGQMLVAMTSWIFLMRILASIGSEAVAGATIAIRIMMFTMMPAWGMSNAAATLVGQNLGAQQPERAEASVWQIGRYNMAYLVLIAMLFFAFPQAIVGFFSEDPKVVEVGAEWLRILSYSLFVYGWWMVSVQAFNGAGDTRTPTWINVVFFWLIQIPLAWYLALYMGLQEAGVFWAVFVSETSVGLFTLWLFSRGRWKTTQV